MTDNACLEERLKRLRRMSDHRTSAVGNVMQRIGHEREPSVSWLDQLRRWPVSAAIGLTSIVLIGLLVGIAVLWQGPAAYGIDDLPERLWTLKSIYARGWVAENPFPPKGGREVKRLSLETYLEPDRRYWTCTEDRRINASDGVQFIFIDHEQRTCRIGQEQPLALRLTAAQKLDTIAGGDTGMLSSAGFRRTRTEIVRGKTAHVYERTYVISAMQFRSVIWLDPETGIPLKVQKLVLHSHAAPGAGPEMIVLELSDIRPNAEPPPNAFGFQPPDDYEVDRRDREPEAVNSFGGVSSRSKEDVVYESRFVFNLNDRGVLVCWAKYDISTTPPTEVVHDLRVGEPIGRPYPSSSGTRQYRNYLLAANDGQDHRWYWSLLLPTDAAGDIAADPPAHQGASEKIHVYSRAALRPTTLPRGALAEIVTEAQRLTLPADAPTDAILTLQQIEAWMDRLEHRRSLD